MAGGGSIEVIMKHKYKDIKGSRREFLFEIPLEEVKRRLDKAYDDIREGVSIPGFRKGKAPRELLEKFHSIEVRERAAREMVSDSYRQALRESNTVPVGLPQISDIEFKDGKNATYKATVDIKPKVDPVPYDKIRIKKKPVDIKEEDLEKYISALQESYAQFKAVEERPAKLGDYIICDVVCEIDGKPKNGEQKNIWFLMDKNHSLPELVDGLVGASKGQMKEIEATLPHEKKRAFFKVRVNLIKEKELPQINDDFVKGMGAYQNVAQFKDAAKKDLMRKKENEVMTDMNNQILEKLLENSHFSPPQGLVGEEMEKIVSQAKEDLRKNNAKEEDIEKRIGQLQEAIRNEATKRVKLFFILDEIATHENISVSKEEIDNMLNLLAQQSDKSLEDVKKYYTQNNLLEYLNNQIKETKIMEFLMSKVEIKQTKH
ncbi:trigger factor [Omnitrophica bacterium]|nr:trigger factor [Candidatus Omnitrophota bacterium]